MIYRAIRVSFCSIIFLYLSSHNVFLVEVYLQNISQGSFLLRLRIWNIYCTKMKRLWKPNFMAISIFYLDYIVLYRWSGNVNAHILLIVTEYSLDKSLLGGCYGLHLSTQNFLQYRLHYYFFKAIYHIKLQTLHFIIHIERCKKQL